MINIINKLFYSNYNEKLKTLFFEYKYIISNTASTSYYFVFSTQIAVSIAIGGFNCKFIRIG